MVMVDAVFAQPLQVKLYITLVAVAVGVKALAGVLAPLVAATLGCQPTVIYKDMVLTELLAQEVAVAVAQKPLAVVQSVVLADLESL